MALFLTFISNMQWKYRILNLLAISSHTVLGTFSLKQFNKKCW